MARPRIIKMDGGEVSFQGFTKEQADALVAHLNNFGKSEVKSPVSGEIPHKAVGVCQSEGVYKVVTLGFDLVTQQATILSVQDVSNAREASIQFKMKASEYNFVQ